MCRCGTRSSSAGSIRSRHCGKFGGSCRLRTSSDLGHTCGSSRRYSRAPSTHSCGPGRRVGCCKCRLPSTPGTCRSRHCCSIERWQGDIVRSPIGRSRRSGRLSCSGSSSLERDCHRHCHCNHCPSRRRFQVGRRCLVRSHRRRCAGRSGKTLGTACRWICTRPRKPRNLHCIEIRTCRSYKLRSRSLVLRRDCTCCRRYEDYRSAHTCRRIGGGLHGK